VPVSGTATWINPGKETTLQRAKTPELLRRDTAALRSAFAAALTKNEFDPDNSGRLG